MLPRVKLMSCLIKGWVGKPLLESTWELFDVTHKNRGGRRTTRVWWLCNALRGVIGILSQNDVMGMKGQVESPSFQAYIFGEDSLS